MADHGERTLHILGLGDVGGALLTGLMLTHGPFSGIGIYDPDHARCLRYEQEMNQILPAYGEKPRVRIISRENLFDCHAFAFTASAGVPPVGAGITDVRMVQLEKNRSILTPYVQQAAQEGYKGMFFQVSDPVDLLCQTAYKAGLDPSRIIGCGLGVMLARAAYQAEKRGNGSFLRDGRVYGPHGKGLVVANSTGPNYDHALSLALTEETVTANLRIRDTGFKPYIAPGLSSGCRTILRAMAGDWFDGSVFTDGIFWGCRARRRDEGIERESLTLHPLLEERVRACFKEQRICQKD